MPKKKNIFFSFLLALIVLPCVILLSACGGDDSCKQNFSCTTAGYEVKLVDDPRFEDDVFKLIYIYKGNEKVGRVDRSSNNFTNKGELSYYPPNGDCVIYIKANESETGTISNMKCNGIQIQPVKNGELEGDIKHWEFNFGTFEAGTTINITFDCSFVSTYLF